MQKVDEIRADLAKRDDRAARSYLPDLDEYEKLLRYKRSHERSLTGLVALLKESKK